jgi:hypothetical protein
MPKQLEPSTGLIRRPDALFLDRPTAGLHNDQRKKRSAVHKPDEVAEWGSRLVLVSKGSAPTNYEQHYSSLAIAHITSGIGYQTYQAVAQLVIGDEHDQIFARWAEQYHQFHD